MNIVKIYGEAEREKLVDLHRWNRSTAVDGSRMQITEHGFSRRNTIIDIIAFEA